MKIAKFTANATCGILFCKFTNLLSMSRNSQIHDQSKLFFIANRIAQRASIFVTTGAACGQQHYPNRLNLLFAKDSSKIYF
jgi:hypothetical protein